MQDFNHVNTHDYTQFCNAMFSTIYKFSLNTPPYQQPLLEEKVLYRILKGSKALRIWNP